MQWTRVVAPSAQAFYGVGGLAGDGGWTLFVAADSKVLRRREGSWEVAYESKTHAPQRSLVVSSSGLVAVVGEDRVSTCADGCTQAGSLFTERVIPGARAVCADADTIYAVGTGSSLGGVVFRYARASGWSEIVSDLGARSPQGCWVGPDKALYVVARSQVLRVHQATPDSELIQFPTAWSPAQVDSEYFYGIWGTGAQVFAAGTGRKILSRTPSSTWEFVNGTDAGAGGIFYGLVGYDDRETYALGVGLARRTAPSPQWTALAFEGGTLRAGWAAGPDEFYVVGDDGTSGTLFRGAR